MAINTIPDAWHQGAMKEELLGSATARRVQTVAAMMDSAYLRVDVRPITNGFLLRYSTHEGEIYKELYCADPRAIGDAMLRIVTELEMK